MWAGQFPSEVDTGGFGTPDIPIDKDLTYYSMIGRIRRTGRFTGNLDGLSEAGRLLLRTDRRRATTD